MGRNGNRAWEKVEWTGSRTDLLVGTQARKCRTSSGLMTTGNVCGFFAVGITSSRSQFFLRETYRQIAVLISPRRWNPWTSPSHWSSKAD
jgi:hypothetical protein